MHKTSKPVSLIASFVSSLKIDSFLSTFHGSSALIMATMLYGMLGIFIAFCAKRYLRYVFVGALFFFVMIKLLEFSGIGALAFEWARIKTLTGIGPHDTLSMAMKLYIRWMRGHVHQVMSLVVGFLIGIKFV